MNISAMGVSAAPALAGSTGGSSRAGCATLEAAKAAARAVRHGRVTAPGSAATSEDDSDRAGDEVVWDGAAPGDRHARAAASVDDGITRGAAGLRGPCPVAVGATLRAFHARRGRIVRSSDGVVAHGLTGAGGDPRATFAGFGR